MRFLVDAQDMEHALFAGERLIEVSAEDRGGTAPAT